MKVFRELTELQSVPGPVFLAIGVFDGVHRGHQALIAEAQADAAKNWGTAVVMTFEPHPMMFFQKSDAPLRLSSPQHKELLMQRQGVTHLAVLPFRADRAAQTAEEFVRELQSVCRPLGGICVGAEWRFGRGRLGNVALLQEMGAADGFEVDGIPAVKLEGEVISSTAIRMAVARGDLDFAREALGRLYAVMGPVVEGRKLGRKLGFPTANIDTDGFQLPPDGVYEARAMLAGVEHRAVANLGMRPTVDNSQTRVLEVHLPDFEGNLYGRDLEVVFKRFLRGEKKFANLDDLKVQISRDVDSVKSQ